MVPKRKRSKSRRDKRFANKGWKVNGVNLCKGCAGPVVSHAACQKCGFYKGVKVLGTKAERADVRAQARQNRGNTEQALEAAAE